MAREVRILLRMAMAWETLALAWIVVSMALVTLCLVMAREALALRLVAWEAITLL